MSHKPCEQCPFRRDVDPNICATFEANPASFIGQAFGPFFLPCHKQGGFKDNACNPELHQCAGAAAFRANCNVTGLPESIVIGPQDTERFFANPAEFLAHHFQLTMDEAAVLLRVWPPSELTRIEMRKTGVKLIPMKRGD